MNMDRMTEDRTVGSKKYKLYPMERSNRIPVKEGFTVAIEKFLHVVNYSGHQISSACGYPRGTRVCIRAGALKGTEAFISEFHLAKFRYCYHGDKIAYSMITMCTLTPILENKDEKEYVPELADKNGKAFLFYNSGDYDVIDDSMRVLAKFHTQSNSKTIVLAIDRTNDRKIKPSVHVIRKEGNSNEVSIDEALEFLQKLKAGKDEQK